LYAEERRAAILELARDNGRVEVAALAAKFDVTAETIRRDLSVLERAGRLGRVHGGAIIGERVSLEPTLDARESFRTEEKSRIAEAALAWLPEQGAIALDGGSTTHRLAEILPTDRQLTVVTNNLVIAVALSKREDLTVHVVGGRLRGRTLTTVGEVSLGYLGSVRLDVAFLGTNGFTVERGLTTPDSTEAAVKRAFVAAARTNVLLTDHTKFGQEYFAHVADLAQIDAVVTDTALSADAEDAIRAAGPDVVRA
jgi:DeoR family transcriptional regulator, fructose operon transcriptional repressor